MFIKGRGKVEANTTMNTGKPPFLGILWLVNQSKALFMWRCCLDKSINWLHFVSKKRVAPPPTCEFAWRSWIEQGLIYHGVCIVFLHWRIKFVLFWNGWRSDRQSTVKRLIFLVETSDVCDRCLFALTVKWYKLFDNYLLIKLLEKGKCSV